MSKYLLYLLALIASLWAGIAYMQNELDANVQPIAPVVQPAYPGPGDLSAPQPAYPGPVDWPTLQPAPTQESSCWYYTNDQGETVCTYWMPTPFTSDIPLAARTPGPLKP